MKSLLLLGGSRYLLPVIEIARKMGIKTITCDYLPDNIAHRFSDKYENASIVDKKAILKVARKNSVDGVMSFAADPGVVTASYVAEEMGLPFQGSYSAVSVLQNKGKFRSFLRDNGFNCPELFTFGTVDDALAAAESFKFPMICKPVDSAGSKGVARVDCADEVALAAENALEFSIGDMCIFEQFIEKKGPSSDSDAFTVDGKFECISFTSQYFDEMAKNPFAPAAYSMPASMKRDMQDVLISELQRLADLLNLKDGIYNIETRVGIDGIPYIMEVSPRGGGNRLAEMLRYASGVDLIRASVCAAVGLPVENVRMPEYDGYWYQEILHSENGGIFRGIDYLEGFRSGHVVEEQLWIEPGAPVYGFSAANHAFGTVFLRFDSERELASFLENKNDCMRVVVS